MHTSVLPVIAGATATGKTAVAVELAKRINGEIISADSMQVYKHLSIGTAKPSRDELKGVAYHLIDHVEPGEQYHLGRFVQEAGECISDISRRHNQPIVCGGTGLYIRGLLYGIYEGGEPDPVIRQKLVQKAETEGLASLFHELQRVDPKLAALYKPTDPQRIIRALEVFHKTGKPLSSFHVQNLEHPIIPSVLYVLKWPRPLLYDRINRRVDLMMKGGLLEEVRYYLQQGFSVENPAIKALGYRELIDALEGVIPMDIAIEEMKKKSRHYAKRQETWFRSMPNAVWIDVEHRSQEETADQIHNDWKNRKLKHST